MKKLANYRKHAISSVLTVLVLAVLLVVGPASAVSLQLATLSNEVTEGDTVSFSLDVDIDSDERIPFEEFALRISYLNDTVLDTCYFYPNGELASCDNETFALNVTSFDSGLFGYGYNYGYGYSLDFLYTKRVRMGGLPGSLVSFVPFSPTFSDQPTTFGYGYGYGYAPGITGEIQYGVQWTTPDVNETTTFKAEFGALAIGDVKTEYKSKDVVEVIVSNLEATVENTPSSTGGGSGVFTGSSSITNTVANLFNLDQNEIRSASFEGSSSSGVQTVNVTEEFLSGLDDEPREALTEYLRSNGQRDAEVEVSTRTYEVTFDNGTTQMYTSVETTVDLGGLEGPVTIHVVVPKSIAVSASEIIGNFDVLADDPIISFSAQGGVDEEISFAFLGDIDPSELEFVTTQSLEEEPTEEPVVISEPVAPVAQEDSDQAQAPGLGGFVLANAPTAVGIVVALLVIAALLYFALRRDEEEPVEEKPKKKTASKKKSTAKKAKKE